jgi:DNA-binding transcriptional LysR family regulator
VLTPTGQLLYRRARTLLDDAGAIERAAHKISAGWEAEISIAVEILFPTWMMFECLDRFAADSPQTRIEWYETVLEGTTEALLTGRAELAISGTVPTGFAGEPLLSVRFLPVAHPDHELHKLGRPLDVRDLRKYRHLVVRDSSTKRDKNVRTVEAAQRWTVTNMSTSIGAASRGYGFAWLPEYKIQSELAEGTLKALPMRDGQERRQQLYLVFADREGAGPGTLRLGQILREETANACARLGHKPEGEGTSKVAKEPLAEAV